MGWSVGCLVGWLVGGFVGWLVGASFLIPPTNSLSSSPTFHLAAATRGFPPLSSINYFLSSRPLLLSGNILLILRKNYSTIIFACALIGLSLNMQFSNFAFSPQFLVDKLPKNQLLFFLVLQKLRS